MADICNDNRFEIIARAKKALLEGTNIETDKDEMKVIDNILFRCWQMGWLDRYDTADTPQTEELKCRNGRYYKSCEYEGNCNPTVCFKALDEFAEMLKDEPQTERSGR